DNLCRSGMVCEDVPGSLVGPLCVEGPPLNTDCWPTEAPYRVQTGRGFLVTGSLAPRPPVAITVGGRCVQDLSRDQLLVNRIPLDAPHCQNIPDGTSAADALKRLPQGPPGVWG